MDIINFGSLNLDYVYAMPHFVRPGETLCSEGFCVACGGKGLNQSLAAARADARVFHAGALGTGGDLLRDCLEESGVNTQHLRPTEVQQGHAVIQVSADGENCIILFPGSNNEVTTEHIDHVFSQFKAPALVMVQNEISNLDYIVAKAHHDGFSVVLNASPIDESLLKLDFSQVDWLMINEIEGAQISGAEQPEQILEKLHRQFPAMGIVLTLGRAGCICLKDDLQITQGIYRVNVVDTTAAGDTFSGYFVAGLAAGQTLEASIRQASMASALAVSRMGAAPSIPTLDEVQAANLQLL